MNGALRGYRTAWGDALKYAALGSFSLWLSASPLKLQSWQ